MNGIADSIGGIIRQILDLPDENLQDLPIEHVEKFVASLLTENEPTLVAETIKEWREMDLTKQEVASIREEMVKEITNFAKNIGELVPIKQMILDKTMESLGNMINQAATQYGVYDIIIDWEKLHPAARIPEYAEDGARGMDLFMIEDVGISAGTTGLLIRTGLAAAMPEGWGLDVRMKSGLSKNTALRISNTPGTIEDTYTDEIGILVDNIGTEPILLKKGQKFAQLLVQPTYRSFNREAQRPVKEIKTGRDRNGGFGSSGLF